MSTAFMAFENETDVLSVGGMSIENRLDRISIYGSLDITKDKSGLTDALVLKRVIDAAIDEMKRDKNLPDTIQTLKPEEISNPF
jgi:hypothetical protein